MAKMKLKISLRQGSHSTVERWGKFVEVEKMADVWPIFEAIKAQNPHLRYGYKPRIEPLKNVQDESLAVRCAKSGRLATR